MVDRLAEVVLLALLHRMARLHVHVEVDLGYVLRRLFELRCVYFGCRQCSLWRLMQNGSLMDHWLEALKLGRQLNISVILLQLLN